MSSRLKGPLWVFLLGAAGLIAITMGLRQTFGLYQIPATTHLAGVTSASFSLAIACQNLIWGLLSPIFGGLADRYGAARVAANASSFLPGPCSCMSRLRKSAGMGKCKGGCAGSSCRPKSTGATSMPSMLVLVKMPTYRLMFCAGCAGIRLG